MYELDLTANDFYRPLFPESRDQGDPYVLTLPASTGARFRFYCYVTGEDRASGRAFPVYGSNDLAHWESLGGSLVADLSRDHWACCVQRVAGLAQPYVMIYSRGKGHGELGHIGHTLRRATSATPEGPFVDSGHILTPGLDFAIDADVYRNRSGRFQIAFAADFVQDEPLGTGLVEADLSEDLSQITSPIRTLARAGYAWQIYDAQRKMPWKQIPGVDWETDRVVWNTMEGPVGGLASPRGRRVYLYSGGCFFRFYGVGALVEQDDGELLDVSSDGNLVLWPSEEDSFLAPGHCSLVREVAGDPLIMVHARFNGLTSPRQMCLVPLRWTADGRPVAVPRNELGTEL